MEELQQMVQQIGEGLTTLVDGLSKAGAPPEIIEPFAASLEAFTAGADSLSGAGQPQQGAAPMEAGGAQAVPAGSNQVRG